MSKILTLTSPKYTEITRLFFNSIQLGIDDTLIIKSHDEGGNADFGTANNGRLMKYKAETIVKILELMEDVETLFYTDSDVIFNVPFSDFIFDGDICFQDDCGTACAGLFICRKSEELIRLFKDVANLTNETNNDQIVLNQILKKYNIKYSLFPKDVVSSYGLISGGKIWNGEDFEIPEYKAFHANYTIGIENKLKLMYKAL